MQYSFWYDSKSRSSSVRVDILMLSNHPEGDPLHLQEPKDSLYLYWLLNDLNLLRNTDLLLSIICLQSRVTRTCFHALSGAYKISPLLKIYHYPRGSCSTWEANGVKVGGLTLPCLTHYLPPLQDIFEDNILY